MARLESKEAEGNWNGEDFGEASFNALQKVSDELKDGEVVGAVVRFPYADGYAFYRVTKEKPLTLQHIPYGDAWNLPYPMIRGLRLADIKAEIVRNKALAKLFSKQEVSNG